MDPYYLTGTTSLAINVPQPILRNVTGSIANFGGVSSLGVTTTARLSFYGADATNSHVQYTVYSITDSSGNGTFTQAMPDGTYKALMRIGGYTSSAGTTIDGATENMNLQNIGTFTVSETNTTANLAIPNLGTLSGSASFAGGSLPAGPFTITAADSSMPNLGYINTNFSNYPGLSSGGQYAYWPRNTTFTMNTFGGAYSVTLGAESTYNMSYSMTVQTTAGTNVGTATYTPSDGSVNLTAAGTTYNFPSLVTLPSLVKISGRITGPGGGAQQHFDYGTYTTLTSMVLARSTSIIGQDGNLIPGLTYYANANADTNGYYTIYLLPGYNYELYFGSDYMSLFQ